MKTAEIRTKLHRFIDSAEDKKLKAMYTIFEDNIEEDYTDEFKAELDRRYEEYQQDGKKVTKAEMDEKIKAILSKRK